MVPIILTPFCLNFNPLQGEDVEEVGGEEKGEGKKKKKKRSKKTAAAVEEDEQGGGKEDEGPSLIDIGSRETSPAPAAALTAKTESPRKKSPAREVKKEGEGTYRIAGNFMDGKFLLDPSNFDTLWLVNVVTIIIIIWITLYGEFLIYFTFSRACCAIR